MYDVIIVGAGPAGISASLYTQRANLKTLVIYKKTEKSSLEKTEKIENFYGFKNGISGNELYQNGIEQAQKLGVNFLEDEVINIRKEELFEVQTTKQNIRAKKVILATGNPKKKPQIKGIEKFEGKGVSYCAICDGFFFKNKRVAVIGNGDYAISETNDLINLVKSATILTNGEKNNLHGFRAENVEINDKKIKEIKGNNNIEEIEFDDNTNIKIDGIFIAQGVAGSTEFAKKLGAEIQNNKIVVNENMETSINGLYACGDCVGGLYQISKAIYDGTKAGMQVIKYIKKIYEYKKSITYK